jgi:polysaccharide export outer membrane protein
MLKNLWMKREKQMAKWFVAGVLSAGLFTLNAGTAFAAPTAQQMQMFQSLPKAQQEALMKQYGGNASAVQSISAKPVQQEVGASPVVEAREIKSEVANSEQVQAATAATNQADLKEKKVSTTVTQKLEPFGYDLFAGSPSTFAPLGNAPVPADYRLGPGDSLNVQHYGAENQSYEVQVDREGRVQLPNVGPVQLSGLKFDAASQLIKTKIKEAVIGVEVSVTAGALRSIRVFVLGDVFKPGAYVVSGLSTMSNALLSSGGIKTIGSLRNVQLKRKGKVVSTMDLYEFLLKGDMSKDLPLLEGDVIFVPTLKRTVAIAGEVKRPAIYELKYEKTIDQVIKLAGGFSQSASPVHSKLERIRKDGYREVKDINLLSKAALKKIVQNGDTLRVLKTVDEYKDIVLVKGSLSRPGEYQWQAGLRIADLFSGNAADVFMPRTDLDHVFVKRETGVDRNIELLMVDLKQALQNQQSKENIALNARDEVLILNFDDNRVAKLAPWVQIMQRQAKRNQLPKMVKVFGSVNYPGNYPLVKGMTLADLFSVAGGATITAMPNALLRHESQFNKSISVEHVDLNERLESLNLQAMDELIVLDQVSNDNTVQRLKDLNARLKQQATAARPSQLVNIQGLVRFPGEYPLTKGMKAKDLVALAGGLLESAYQTEAELIKRTIDPNSQSLKVSTQTVVLPSATAQDYPLESMDSLVIKRKPDWAEHRSVTLTGEVKYPGTYVLEKNETLASVINRAGGMTQDAFIEGIFLKRPQLLQKQTAALDKMRLELESIIAQNASSKPSPTSASGANAGEYLSNIMQQANQAKATGRLTLVSDAKDLQTVFNEVVLKDGDQINIPMHPNTVSVMGEVYASQNFNYSASNAYDYIQMAGGGNQLADLDNAYIVKASGKVVPLESNGFFYASAGVNIEQGDIIVVPMDITKLQPLELWSEVATIAGQIGLALASFHAVGAF